MISSAQISTDGLVVTWTDGTSSTFHYRWLRDNCQSPASIHSTGQRLIETVDIPADIKAKDASLSADGLLSIHWLNDTHVSEFPADWLYVHRPEVDADVNAAPPRTLWNNSLSLDPVTFQFAQLIEEPAHQREWLLTFQSHGFTLLQGVGTSAGMVTEVASLFGYVRETNYGSYFDVKSVINPNNLAYTGLALSPHTDNPYRDPVPTIQLLHCLQTEVSGGDSTVVDGFYLAQQLREADSNAFELLTSIPVQFRFQDAETDLLAEKPIIGLDVAGKVNCISFNNRSIQPFRLPIEQMDRFYDAYTTFAKMVNDPENQVAFKLKPGELFMVDNRRVLHGRTGYASNGSRHLQGCYADIDSLLSRLAVLQRKT